MGHCLCGAFGQLFIFLTISTFGSLMSTTITTTWEFCSILLSVVWNGNALTQPQLTAVALVFGGLTLKEVWKATSKKATTKKVKGKSESSSLSSPRARVYIRVCRHGRKH